jgi:hypothetical protein
MWNKYKPFILLRFSLEKGGNTSCWNVEKRLPNEKLYISEDSITYIYFHNNLKSPRNRQLYRPAVANLIHLKGQI